MERTNGIRRMDQSLACRRSPDVTRQRTLLFLLIASDRKRLYCICAAFYQSLQTAPRKRRLPDCIEILIVSLRGRKVAVMSVDDVHHSQRPALETASE